MSLACHDCGLGYNDPTFADFVIPDAQWHRISPRGDGSGILCVTCMIKRANAAGVVVKGSFTSGPFADHGWIKPQS